jgi:hypothetical protein
MGAFREFKIIALGIRVAVAENWELEARARELSLKEVEKEGRTNSHHVKTKIFNSTLQHMPWSEGVKRKEGVEAC